MAIGETPAPGIPERDEAETPLQPRSLFRNAVVQNTQATRIRPRTRTALPDGAAESQPTTTAAEPREYTFRIEKVLKVMQDMDKFSGEGKNPAADIKQFSENIEVAITSVGAPQSFLDICSMSEEHPDGYNESDNRALYALLHIRTKGLAHSTVKRFGDEKDGRLALLTLVNEFLPFDSINRQEAANKISSWVILPTRPPELQIDTLLNMIAVLSSVKAEPITHAEKIDSLIGAFSRCSGDAYDVLVSQLNKDTMKDVLPTVNEIRLQAGSAYRTYEAKMKTRRNAKTFHGRDGSRDKETANIISKTTSSKPSSWNQNQKGIKGAQRPHQPAKYPCSLCKTQGVQSIHYIKDCPLLKHLPATEGMSQAIVPARTSDFHKTEETENARAAKKEITFSDEESEDDMFDNFGLAVLPKDDDIMDHEINTLFASSGNANVDM